MGRQLTIQDAAVELGISAKTVRRRLQAGKLVGQLVDGRWVVDLPDVVKESSSGPGRVEFELVAMRSELDSLKSERDFLRQQVAAQSETIFRLVNQRALPAGEQDRPAVEHSRRWWEIWR